MSLKAVTQYSIFIASGGVIFGHSEVAEYLKQHGALTGTEITTPLTPTQ